MSVAVPFPDCVITSTGIVNASLTNWVVKYSVPSGNTIVITIPLVSISEPVLNNLPLIESLPTNTGEMRILSISRSIIPHSGVYI